MDTKQKDKTLDITIKTPAGHPNQFSFKSDTRVSKVIREVVEHFVDAGQLEEGDYGLALVREGRVDELALGARLAPRRRPKRVLLAHACGRGSDRGQARALHRAIRASADATRALASRA